MSSGSAHVRCPGPDVSGLVDELTRMERHNWTECPACGDVLQLTKDVPTCPQCQIEHRPLPRTDEQKLERASGEGGER